MGSYSTLFIDGKEVCSRRHELDPVIMTLFQAPERCIRRGTIEELLPDNLEDDRSNADDKVELLTYETTLGTLKDRLDLMGFTFQFVRKEYERLRKINMDEASDEVQASYSESYLRIVEARQRALKGLTFDRWVKLFGPLWKREGYWGEVNPEIHLSEIPSNDASLDELHAWYMRTADVDTKYSCISEDTRVFLRIVCEILPRDTAVIYDLSELVYESGYSDYAEEMASFAEQYLDGGYATTRRIIVLTEGRFDQRAIESSLSLLHPGLRSYFSFLDFDTLNIQGGVSSVLNTLKAFISVGITNRIVALLDNDTAAHASVQAAKLGNLPQNVRIVFLPHLPSAEKYPTLGPGGLTKMDVNGLACSIELYLGADVLGDSPTQLIPIQWKGYDDKLRRYQGEIMSKPEIQSRVIEKLEQAKQDPDLLSTQDWIPMEMVLQSLITAFHDMPPIDYGLETLPE